MSLQLPLGAPLHLSGVICIRPCSPAPPTVFGLQLLSCIANDASTIGGTNHRESTEISSSRRSAGHELLCWFPYLMKVAMISSLHGANVVCLAFSNGTTTSSSSLMGAGDQPWPLTPQFSQSIWPLGPLVVVTSAAHKITVVRISQRSINAR